LELHALGVVDVLAEDGEGEAAVRRYIRMHDRQHHARSGFHRALQMASPLDLHALRRMADVWVDTAMGLGPRDLETIDYLLRAQRRPAAHSVSTEDEFPGAQALQDA
jgi:DSF synthase